MRHGIAAAIEPIDALLPAELRNLPSPATSPKSSWTVHWEGPVRGLADETDQAAEQRIRAIAAEHIAKDWGGGFGGSGIMYAFAIAPSGRIYRTRNPLDVVLWHSNTAQGNAQSIPVLLLAGTDQDATPAQLEALRGLVTDDFGAIVGPEGEPFALFGHREWTQTTCPGDRAFDYLERLRAGVLEQPREDDDVTDAQVKAITDKIEAEADSIAIYLARSQRGLDVVSGTRPPLDGPARDTWLNTDPALEVQAARARARG